MASFCYGTKTTLAWLLGHYVFNRTHYTYFAREFFPYRLRNPPSSNPLDLYQAFYKAWRDEDQWHASIQQHRINLSKLIAQSEPGDPDFTANLQRICERVSLAFFYPVVFRVDETEINDSRKVAKNSALDLGSEEFVVEDLQEDEFEILFLDVKGDADFDDLVIDAADGRDDITVHGAVERLLRRCY